jgi:hypothetical protein
MKYVLIKGASYRDLEFPARELIRDDLRNRLETNGIRFLEYNWIWDENDRCLLLAGTYKSEKDAIWWIKALEEMGFEICVSDHIT